MKQQRHIQTTRTLLSRFRYWGRKNYAAFASMGREFQIGHLHTNVVDVALRKQNAAQTIPYHTFMTLEELKDTVDMANIGLKGSPTNVKQSFTKQAKGKGLYYKDLSPEDAVETIVAKLEERHII